MTTAETWKATQQVADLWLQSPLIERFVKELPTNNLSTTGIPEMLRSIDGSTGLVSNEPLIPNKWHLVAQQLPMVDLNTLGGRQYLAETQPISDAARSNTAWLRSRLPRFPNIPVPQLAPNTNRTSRELGHGLPWLREMQTGGLENRTTPPMVSDLLRIDSATYAESVQELAKAMAETPEWTAYEEISKTLTKADRATLIAFRSKLAPSLRDNAVNRFEPDRALRRERYRDDQVSTAVQQLSGIPAQFAEAFDKVDDLIDLVSLRVLGQLIAYGSPVHIEDARDLDRNHNEISFGSDTPTVGRSTIVKIADPLTPDYAIVTGFSWHSDESEGTASNYKAQILPQSRNQFRE
ncbi:hypothetical protein [Rhodococcus qingshengii]|uniref:hypothetical protein n=1 Tax=Rhodococcus qingshengii TaxID=334542 RepID=UPI0035DC8FC2